MKTVSQEKLIIDYLKICFGRKITPLDSLRLFGCFRLASRIHSLKKQFGRKFHFKSEFTEVNGKRVKQYWIENKNNKIRLLNNVRFNHKNNDGLKIKKS